MESKEKTLNISKIKKQVKRNNLDSISSNNNSITNTSSSGHRISCRGQWNSENCTKCNRYMERRRNEQSELGELSEYITNKTEGKKVSSVVGGDKFEQTETIKDDNGKEVTIPKGFGVAEDSNTVVDDGIVITDGTNEFVWVPVDDPSTMFTEIPEGEEEAKLTGVETTTNIYSKLRVRSGDSYSAGAPGTRGIREPDVLSNFDTDPQYYRDILGFESTKNMADSMVTEYKAMSDSVKKYHGFYIGRYELTGTTEKPTVKSGDVLTAAEAGNWYGLYKACQNVIKNNTDVKSTMIYGCQWDETMSWLSRNGYNTDTNSSSWGNYGSDSPINTGSVSTYKANEIFDLAGNYWEWTQEAESTGDRVYRGRCYSNSDSNSTAAERYANMAAGAYGVSTRVLLYIS